MRFYKPRQREYVSTQVDVPWEFLQGVTEQKQKGFDTALATGDAAANLLNFEVIPGDVEDKRKIQEKYNNEILQVQEYVQQTGDYNGASRKLSSVVKNIAQDLYISNMKSAVPIWKEQQKEVEKANQEGELLDFNRNSWDYMYSTVDPTSGSSRAYNQQIPYKAKTLGKEVYNSFKDSIDGKVIQTYGNKVGKNENGEWIYLETGKRLGSDLLKIMQQASYEIQGRYPTYFRDRNAYEISAGISKEGEIPKWQQSMLSALANEYSVNNVKYDYKLDPRDQFKWEQNQQEPTPQFNPDTTFVVVESQKPITVNDLQSSIYGADTRLVGGGTGGVSGISYTKTSPKTFNEVPSKFRKAFETAYKTFYGNNKYNEVKNGNLELSEDNMTAFVTYYNRLNQGLTANTNTAPIANVSNLHNKLFGFKEEQISGRTIAEGTGLNYPSNTKVYDVANSEWITLGEIKTAGSGDKVIKYRVNKEYDAFNPMYQLSGKDPYFAKGYSLVGEDAGGNVHQYILPSNVKNDNATMEAEVNTALYSEGLPVNANLFGETFKVLYANNTFSLVNVDENTGQMDIHTINGQPAVFSDPESLIYTLENVIKKEQSTKK